jgi:DNA-binding SARP family transcriptional activator
MGSGPALELRLLGAFGLAADGLPIQLPPAAQRVLAFLALDDRPLSRPFVSGSLWSETSDARAAASLRTVVWRLHHAAPNVIVADARRLALASSVGVDYRERSTLAERVLHGEVTDPGAVSSLCSAGDLLPDWYDDWLELGRERYRFLRVRALERLADGLQAHGRLAEAAEVAMAAVVADPLRETAQRALIRVFLAEGNAFEAVRQFRLYRSLTLRHLGTEPSEKTLALVRHLGPGLAS